MKTIYQPLRTSFKLESKDDIQDRVDSEDWYTNCKGYPLTEFENKVDKLAPRIERL